VDKFKQRFGKEPDGIHVVGSHADGTATTESDIDLVIETNLPLSKFQGPGFEFFKDINPGKVPPGISGIGTGPGEALIGGTGPGSIPKAGLIDPFFRLPGNVRPPSIKVK
jgi:hypothetical protein